MDATERFLENEAKLASEIHARGKEPAWLEELRGAARARFLALGFPTTGHEEWKYVNLTRLNGCAFELADDEGLSAAGALVAEHRLKGAACAVVVDGQYRAELSDLDGLPDELVVESINEFIAREPDAAKELLGQLAKHEDHALVALNMALFRDGVAISVPKGLVVEKPVQLLHLMTAQHVPAEAQLRHLIRLGQSASATVIEHYVGEQGQPYFNNVVCEVSVGPNASLDRYKVELESDQAFHIASYQCRQARDSRARSHLFSLGAALSRNDVNGSVTAPGCECTVNGLYFARGDQLVDHHIAVDHQSPHCNSHQLVKGILADKAKGVFNGKIFVRERAVGTDAQQQNSNLLLSERATINTKPQLEIVNDDVKCSHGATVGQLDPDALFYLRARGIGRDQARQMLVLAFATEVVDGCHILPLKMMLNDALTARLG